MRGYCVNDSLNFNKPQIHGLFAKYMFSGLKRLHGDIRVGIGGRADQHRVDSRVPQQDAVVLGQDLRARAAGKCFDVLCDMRSGDAADPGVGNTGENAPDVDPADPAGTDDA